MEGIEHESVASSSSADERGKAAPWHRRIAIIGMACRFPQCSDWQGYWQNLRAGKNAIQEVARDRWDVGKHYSPDATLPNKTSAKWSGLITDHNRFDHRFFGVSPREAANMDPQQRVLLEETWHCIEDSGVALAELQRQATSVYVGVITNGYHGQFASRAEAIDGYSVAGHYTSIAANRISYALGLSGASISMDVACASSLFALHQARLSLERGESRYALVASVSLTTYLWKFVAYAKQRLLSPDGQCKAFDQDANGFVPGEGAAALLLQPLDLALRDRNVIYGVLEGTAVNHGGAANSLTAPRAGAQHDVLVEAYAAAAIDPGRVTYVEAHGTGTSLGDPIEVEALARAFGSANGEPGRCGIGSVKTNIGHLEACAGLAGLIKVLLMMRHRELVPTLNLSTLNPMIDFSKTPFFPVRRVSDWAPRQPGEPLFAGVSAFGFGGANAHAVLSSWEGSPAAEAPGCGGRGAPDAARAEPFLLSAKSERALSSLLGRWRAFAQTVAFDALPLSDLCRTVVRSRAAFAVRAGTKVASNGELRRWLGRPEIELHRPEARSIAVVFQRQRALRGKREVEQLRRELPGFGAVLDEVLAEVDAAATSGRPLAKAIRASRFREADLAPLRLCVALACFRSLLRLGVEAAAIAAGEGEELTACCACEMLTAAEAVALLRGGRSGSSPALRRPARPLFDPSRRRLIRRLEVTAPALERLRDELRLDPGEALQLAERARSLVDRQFTFRKFIEDWARFAQRHGFDLMAAVRGGDWCSELLVGERLLCALAIYTSLEELNRKWSLSSAPHCVDVAFVGVARWIAANVLPREALSAWLLGAAVDLDALASTINERHQGHADDLAWFERVAQQSDAGSSALGWLRQAGGGDTAAALVSLSETHWLLGIGDAVEGSPPFDLLLGSAGDPGAASLLLELACRGVAVRWELVYPDGSFQKVPAPGYAFDRRTFWPMAHRSTATEAELQRLVENDLLRLMDRVVPGVAAPGADAAGADAAGADAAGADAARLDQSFAESGFDPLALCALDESIRAEFCVELGCASVSESPRALVERLMAEASACLINKYPSCFTETGGVDAAIAPVVPSELGVEPRPGVGATAAEEASGTLVGRSPALPGAPEKPDDASGGPEIRYLEPVWIPLPLSETEPAGPCLAIAGLPSSHGLASSISRAHGGADVPCLELEADAPWDLPECERFIARVSAGSGTIYVAPAAALVAWSGPERELAARARAACGAVMRLCQAIGRASRDGRLALPRLKLITAGAYGLGPGDPPQNPMGAALIGLVSSLAVEYPSWSLTAVDLEPMQALDESVIDALVNERCDVARSPILLRGGLRFRRSYRQLELDAAALDATATDSGQAIPRRNGRYVVLGGGGGIGRRIGRELMRAFDALVCLVGRRTGPEEPLPPGIVYRSCDITNERELAALMEALQHEWGGIDGIFHSADVPYSRLHRDADSVAFDASLGPKLNGTAHLAHLARSLGERVFLAFFSSIAGLFPVQGGAAYAAANAYMDAFAHFLAGRLDVRVKVVNWGLWLDTGLAQRFQGRHVKAGFEPFVDGEGEAACWAVLRGFATQVAPLKATAEKFAERGFAGVARVRRLAPALVPLPENFERQVTDRLADDLSRRPAERAVFPELQALSATLLLHTFRSWGIRFEAGSCVRHDEIVTRLGVIGKYSRLVQALLRMLERRGWLQRCGDAWSSTSELDRALAEPRLLEEQRDRFLQRFPAYEPHVTLIERCQAHLAQVLNGGKPYTEVLFPGGKLDLVQPIYRDNPSADFHNRTVAATLDVLLRAQPSGARPLRVLEVGAGTGGTTEFVVDMLCQGPHRVDYSYTDVSAAFINHGRQRFAQRYPAMRFELLDIERDPEQQGHRSGSYDLVFASNVVHATRDVLGTLARLKTLLVGGGLLVLNEITAVQDFATLSFGLTDGWWSYRDEGRRLPDSPLLDVPRWRALLASLGFGSICLPAGGAGDADIQHVIMAVSDGVVERAPARHELRGEGPSARLTGRAESSAPGTAKPRGSEPRESRPRLAMASQAQAAAARATGRAAIREPLESYLREVFSTALALDFGDVRADEELAAFGVDSLIMMEVQDRLSREIGSVPSTLLFQYRTLAAVADYLEQHRGPELERLFRPTIGGARPVPSGPEPAEIVPALAAPPAAHPAPSAAASRAGAPWASAEEPIAIVGAVGRYPGAPDLAALWQRLAAGESCISTIPPERWDYHRFFDPSEQQSRGGRMYSRWGGFIDEVACFDSLFFGISPKEAAAMDPQERLMLELAWAAIEDSGHTPTDLRRGAPSRGNVGVFIGVTGNSYQWLGLEAWARGAEMAHSFPWSIANRISYQLDFDGPSVPVDTACSSSLAAIHFAAASLRRGECSAALVGGVNLYLHPAKYAYLCHLTMLSRDEKCRAFGAGAGGFVPGEGAGMLLLRPLGRALADGDPIYAVLRGSAVNHGGRTHGFTVPNPGAQANLVVAALEDAGLEARDISYVEAHGTGTLLGDPVEVEGLRQAFDRAGGTELCRLGSLKPNIGHLESAAGVAALTKVLLQMRHRTLAPTLHASTPNPRIDFSAGPFRLVQRCEPWASADGGPLRAGVSSFGAGGLNAHVIVESVPVRASAPVNPRSPHTLLLLSARDTEALRARARRLSAYLERDGRDDRTWLRDLCFTLQCGREPMSQRLAVVSGDLAGFRAGLAHYLEGRAHASLLVGEGPAKGEHRLAPQDDADDAAYLDRLASSGKWHKIARFWVDGLALDWARFYGPGEPQRLSLPTYPFARASHWLSLPAGGVDANSAPLHGRLVPRLEAGASYARRLEPGDPLVRDNCVDGVAYLPFTAQLELAARAAAELWSVGSVEVAVRAASGRALAVPASGSDLELLLEPARGEPGAAGVSFSLSCEQPIARGVLLPHAGEPSIVASRAPVAGERLELERCRERLAALGAALSDYYACSDGVRLGEAELAFDFRLPPAALTDGTSRLRLVHFALLTAQLLPVLNEQLHFACAVESVELAGEMVQAGTVELFLTPGRTGEAQASVDIRAEDGRLVCRYRGVSLSTQADPAAPDFTYLPQWCAAPPERRAGADGGPRSALIVAAGGRSAPGVFELLAMHPGARVICASPAERTLRVEPDRWEFGRDDSDAFTGLAAEAGALTDVYFLALHGDDAPDSERLAVESEWLCLTLLRLIKALDRRGLLQGPVALRVATNGADAIASESVWPASAALHGLCKTIAREYPRLQSSVVDFDLGSDPRRFDYAGAMRALAEDAGRPLGAERLVRDGVWYRRVLRPLKMSRSPADLLRREGVYLIIGGARGVGFETARFLAREFAARTILVGRSAPGPEIEQGLLALEALGGRASYVCADVATASGMSRVVEQIELTHGRAHGVFHSAVVLADQTLANISEENFKAALAPKLSGCARLGELAARHALDFVCFYSSAKSFVGDAGQGNYAAASAFEDSFARHFEQRFDVPAFVINWGYWGEVGVVAEHRVKAVYARQGVGSISSGEGMAVLVRQLASRARQVVAVKAAGPMLRQLGLEPGVVAHTATATPLDAALVERALHDRHAAAPPASEEAEAFPVLDAWVRAAVWRALREAGLFASSAAPMSVEALLHAESILPRHQRLVEALLEMLTRGGQLEQVGERFRARTDDAPSSARLERERRDAEARFPAFAPYYALAARCLDQLWAVLRGQEDAAAVLFPGGSLSDVQAIYRGNRRLEHFNDLCATAAHAAVKQLGPRLPPGVKVRILEFGAGTGGTSAAVLAALDELARVTSYEYTDVSSAFTNFGRQQHGGRHYVRFGTFDVERDAVEQGFEPGSYDVLIGSNVLHAVASLPHALENLKRLLRRGGVLVLNEATALSDFSTLTFGLTRGWWAYTDSWRMPHAPLLTARDWLRRLVQQGFRAPLAMGEPGLSLERSRQALIVAQSDGIMLLAPKEAPAVPAAPLETSPWTLPAEPAAPSELAFAAAPRGGTSLVGAPPGDALRPPNVPVSVPSDLTEWLRLVIRRAVSESLELPERHITDDTSFSEYGVDSVLGISLVENLNRALDVGLRNSVLFDYPSIERLAAHLAAEHGGSLSARHAAGAGAPGTPPRQLDPGRPVDGLGPPEEADLGLELILHKLAAGELNAEMADAQLRRAEASGAGPRERPAAGAGRAGAALDPRIGPVHRSNAQGEELS